MNPQRYDINCDLGEGEPERTTKALMRQVTSANIACGGHAGNVQTMTFAVREALKAGVNIGAHPGSFDRSGFGRRQVQISVEEFEILLIQQIGAVEKIVAGAGVKLHHVKLHGALYHLTDSDAEFRGAYISMIQRFWPRRIVYARAGGAVAAEAGKAGVAVWPEGFLDRRYLADGSLAPRNSARTVLTKSEFLARLKHLTHGAGPISAPVRTWCFHSDTPHAMEFARLARKRLCRGKHVIGKTEDC